MPLPVVPGPRAAATLALLAGGLLASGAAAQEVPPAAAGTASDATDALPPIDDPEATEEGADGERSRLSARLVAGYVWQDDGKFDGGGRVDIQRAGASLGLTYAIDEESALSANLLWQLHAYDFENVSAFGTAWGTVNSVDLSLRYSRRLDDQWSWFAGGLVGFAAENGAEIDQGLRGGGFFGVGYAPSQDLNLGFGLGIVSQIEDNERFFPVISVDWKITDTITLTSRNRLVTGEGANLELVYSGARDWDFAVGASLFGERRFRLDDVGTGRDGVVEEELGDLYLRARWFASPRSSVDLLVGYALETDLTLYNDRGATIANASYDESLWFGVIGSIRF